MPVSFQHTQLLWQAQLNSAVSRALLTTLPCAVNVLFATHSGDARTQLSLSKRERESNDDNSSDSSSSDAVSAGRTVKRNVAAVHSVCVIPVARVFVASLADRCIVSSSLRRFVRYEFKTKRTRVIFRATTEIELSKLKIFQNPNAVAVAVAAAGEDVFVRVLQQNQIKVKL